MTDQLWAVKSTVASGLVPATPVNIQVSKAGTLTDALGMLVWDSAISGWRRVWPQPPSITSFTTGAGSAWHSATLSWSAPGATSYTITSDVAKADGTHLIYSGSGTSLVWEWQDDFACSTSVELTLHATNIAGTTSTPIMFNTPAVPQVTGVYTVGVTWDFATIVFNEVEHANDYLLVITPRRTSDALITIPYDDVTVLLAPPGQKAFSVSLSAVYVTMVANGLLPAIDRVDGQSPYWGGYTFTIGVIAEVFGP